MGKKNTTIWGFWKWHSNHVVLFMAAAIVIVMSTAKRPNWMENNKMQRKDYSSCDMFSGRWVYDNSTRPLYSGLNCAYMNDEIACDKYGRNDTRYQRWRWQPHGCNLPRLVEIKICIFQCKKWEEEEEEEGCQIEWVIMLMKQVWCKGDAGEAKGQENGVCWWLSK